MSRLGLRVVVGCAVERGRWCFVAGDVSRFVPVVRRVGTGLGVGTEVRDERPRFVLTNHAYGQIPKNVCLALSSGRRWVCRCCLGDVRSAGLANGLVPYVHDLPDLGTIGRQSSGPPWRTSSSFQPLPRGREGAHRARATAEFHVHGNHSENLSEVTSDCPRQAEVRRLAARRWSRSPSTGSVGAAFADILLLRATVRPVRGRLPCLLSRSGLSLPAAPGLPWAITFFPGSAPLGGVAAGCQTLVRALDACHLESGGFGLCGTACDDARFTLPPPGGESGFGFLVAVVGGPASWLLFLGITQERARIRVLDSVPSDGSVESGRGEGDRLVGEVAVQKRWMETTGQERWVCTGRAVCFFLESRS